MPGKDQGACGNFFCHVELFEGFADALGVKFTSGPGREHAHAARIDHPRSQTLAPDPSTSFATLKSR